MSDKVEINHGFDGGPEIAGLFVPDLDGSPVGRKKLALGGGRGKMDQVLDGKPHALLLDEEGTRVSQIEYPDLASACAERERKTVFAVVQGSDLAFLSSQDRDAVLAPGVEELDTADSRSKGAKPVG